MILEVQSSISKAAVVIEMHVVRDQGLFPLNASQKNLFSAGGATSGRCPRLLAQGCKSRDLHRLGRCSD